MTHRLAFAAVLLVGAAAAPASAAELVVPRGVPVVVDGVLEDEVWSQARVETVSGGLEVRLQHDGRDLFVAVSSPRSGFASVCLAERDAVAVLHASAALGEIRYERRRDAWTTRARAFDYAMRNTATSPLARAERRRYLEEHGWVASTFHMGRTGAGSAQELHFAGERIAGAAALAIAFRLEDGTILRWPESLEPTDGCADPQLVSGAVPERLAFAPESWSALRLDGVEPR